MLCNAIYSVTRHSVANRVLFHLCAGSSFYVPQESDICCFNQFVDVSVYTINQMTKAYVIMNHIFIPYLAQTSNVHVFLHIYTVICLKTIPSGKLLHNDHIIQISVTKCIINILCHLCTWCSYNVSFLQRCIEDDKQLVISLVKCLTSPEQETFVS